MQMGVYIGLANGKRAQAPRCQQGLSLTRVSVKEFKSAGRRFTHVTTQTQEAWNVFPSGSLLWYTLNTSDVALLKVSLAPCPV